jgi:hypothetical protein
VTDLFVNKTDGPLRTNVEGLLANVTVTDSALIILPETDRYISPLTFKFNGPLSRVYQDPCSDCSVYFSRQMLKQCAPQFQDMQ